MTTFRTVFLFALLLPFIFGGSALAEKPSRLPAKDAPYEAEAVYPGMFENDGLYMRRSTSRPFMGHKDPTHLADIRCRPARDALSTRGTWKGDLRRDGSCMPPGDPGYWAVGNYLNYLHWRKD